MYLHNPSLSVGVSIAPKIRILAHQALTE